MNYFKKNFSFRKNSNFNGFKNNKKTLIKKIRLKKEESMHDKIDNHFKLYDLAKLELLGEANSNYGNFFFQGYVYKPKNIKLEYLGHKNFVKDLQEKDNSYNNRNNFSGLKRRNISFVNPICFIEPNINKKLEKNNSSFLKVDLQIIPRISISFVEEYKNKNKNKINNRNNNYTYVNKNVSDNISKYKIRNDLKKLSMSASCSKLEKIENNSKSNFNMYSKNILRNINILNLKRQLNTKMDLLENQVNNSTKFISNGSKINEEEKPQFKYRFKNLKSILDTFLQ